MLLNQPVTEFTNKEKNKIRAVAYGASSGLIYKQQQISNIFVIADTQEIRIYTIVVSPDTQKYTLVDMDISISTNHHDINQIAISKNGRIFVGGSKGIVESIDYLQGTVFGLFQKQSLK